MTRALLALAAGALLLGTGSASGSSPAPVSFAPSSGHQLAGFALDRESLVLAEDPAVSGACPLVLLVSATGGAPQGLTQPDGPTCRLGSRFWVRPGARAIGVALVKALWVVRRGDTAIAVKASPREPEEVLARVTGIDEDGGPFLGPVVASSWLRLFGRYTRRPGGTLTGSVISGNRRTLWAATGPVPPVGLDDKEHVVSVGAYGAIAMWHAHGARYGRVADAHAKAAAVDHGQVVVLRSDRARLDVRALSGELVSSWPVVQGTAPLLDADAGAAIYLAGNTVHELLLATGRDSIVARAPSGTTLLDAQIERHFVAYAYRGRADPAGRVLVIDR